MSYVYTILAIYILALLGLSYFSSRRQSDEDFLISGRNRPGWQIFLSKFAAGIGAGYFITYTGFAYEYGMGVFALLLGVVLGYLFFAYWATPKIHAESKNNHYYTIGDLVKGKTKSNFCASLANIVSNVILFSWLLVGIIGGGKIISDFGLISYVPAVIITGLVVMLYILLARYKGVLLTDIIQSFVILVLLFAVTVGIVGSDITSLFQVNTGSVDIGTAVGFLIFGILSVFSMTSYYQLTYAAKDEKKLKHAMGLAVVPILIAATMLLLVGLFMAKNVVGLDTGLVFTEALKTFLPVSLLPYAIVLFFAGVMSSADTNVYAISTQLSAKKSLSIKKIRYGISIIMPLTVIFSIVFSDIVDVSIIAGGISCLLSAGMIYLISGGKNPSRFTGSIVGGIIGFVIAIIVIGITPVSLLPSILGSLLGLLWKGRR